MQIVIDIPEREYKTICENNYVAVCACPNLLSNAIKNGTPLPKGHGNLKDMGNIRYIFDLTKTEPTYTGKDIELAIKSMPTVLEADKEVE